MLYEQIQSNKNKTIVFMIIFFLLVQFTGALLGYALFEDIFIGITISTVVLIIYMFTTIANAKSIIMRMNHGKKTTQEEYPMLFNIIEEVCISAGLNKIPDVYIVKEDSPNAFATGFSPEKSAIGVTTALLEKLDRDELEAVIAHEVSHIMNYDIRLSTISLALMSVVILLFDIIIRIDMDDDVHPAIIVLIIIGAIFAPIVAKIIQFAISRNREYLADATAIEYTRNPQALISALIKIDNDPDIVDNISSNYACASMYIADPLKKRFKNDGTKKKKVNLFSTHPAIEDRIDRLKKM